MTDITLHGVSKTYDMDPVVRDLTLHVPAGTMFGLLGPSGCGKTTILRMIAGLLEPDCGDIAFDGVSVLSVPTERRRIGMVFQQHVLFPHMTVEENVGFGLRMQGVKLRQARPRIDEVLELVQLGGYNRRFPGQLSGGQQQRVALARAVVTDPVVLLLDEPLSNLDARLRDDMRVLIRDVQRRLGITTIFVTHDQAEAIELSDRMVVLFEGEAAQEGPPEEVFERPVSSRVARFLGSTNLIPVQVPVYPEEGWVDAPFGRVAVCCGGYAGGSVPRELLLSVRCEHISLHGEDSPGTVGSDGINTFHGRVLDSVFKGGLIFYRVDLEGFPVDVIDRSDRQFVPGARVVVQLPEQHLWVMPAVEYDGGPV
ncbi:MAG: ABC transporter ATP-binding protein [Spirochaetaceae bacterium]|nr:MAG: ABC transporter ATP-binding protein [Spirochaetaceae bacterium]